MTVREKLRWLAAEVRAIAQTMRDGPDDGVATRLIDCASMVDDLAEQIRVPPAAETPFEKGKALTSLKDAARFLSVSAGHLTTMIRRGEIPHVRLGRRVLIPVSVLQKLAEGEVFKRSPL